MDFGSAKKSSRVSMDSLDRPSATGDSGTGGRDAIAPGRAIRSIGVRQGCPYWLAKGITSSD